MSWFPGLLNEEEQERAKEIARTTVYSIEDAARLVACGSGHVPIGKLSATLVDLERILVGSSAGGQLVRSPRQVNDAKRGRRFRERWNELAAAHRNPATQ